MKTAIVVASKKDKAEDTLIYQSLVPLKSIGQKFSAHFFLNNTKGLSKVYNEAITNILYSDKDGDTDCMLFVHDDVYVDDGFIFDKIEDGFSVYDIIGVAGAKNPKIKEPALWHLMTERQDWRGFAAHFAPNMETIGMTSFGITPDTVDILDGVVLAINIKRVKETGWKFNENYTFHHYDISSTLDATKAGLTCGVLPIHIIHQSPGLRDINDPIFRESQKQFLKEYKSDIS